MICHSYSSQDNSWEKISPSGSTPTKRQGHAAVWVPGEMKMYVAAGQDGAAMLTNLESYDTRINTWKQLAPSGTSPSGHRNPLAVWSTDQSRMYMFDGHETWSGSAYVNDIRFYDSHANTWQEL